MKDWAVQLAAQARAEGVELTGDDPAAGPLSQALRTGQQVEMTGHLGNERHAVEIHDPKSPTGPSVRPWGWIAEVAATCEDPCSSDEVRRTLSAVARRHGRDQEQAMALAAEARLGSVPRKPEGWRYMTGRRAD